jgi:NADH-quinone oxidoreductase subunit M
LPGLNGFVSEFLTVLGAFTSPYLGIGFGALAATGIILGAVYMLHMVGRVIFGPLRTPPHEDLISVSGDAEPVRVHAAARNDLNRREALLLVPIAVAVVVLGVMPAPVLDSILEPVRLVRRPNIAAQAALPVRPSHDRPEAAALARSTLPAGWSSMQDPSWPGNSTD